jgi:hypothetical protein
MSQAAVTPIEDRDLEAVGEFLNAHLNKRISAQAWVDSLRHPWCASRPNFGMQLRDGARLVGVFCAIYSDQIVDGKSQRFCNPHSWCVLPQYRTHGISLVLALLRQPGYHFIMLTPNPKVAQIFRRLRFKDLADGLVVFANLPSWGALARGTLSVSDPTLIAPHLTAPARRDFELHRAIPWLHFVAFGRDGQVCLVVYKIATWKRLPCARLIHISDPATFDRHRALLQTHLLLRHGLLVSRVEARFLSRVPRLAIHQRRQQAKLCLSTTLRDGQVSDLYSELVALDI